MLITAPPPLHSHAASAQRDTCLDIVDSIRYQHRALSAALLNLEHHRGGRQATVEAYTTFAAPLLTSYGNLLAVYPASIALVARVRVSGRAQQRVNNNNNSSSNSSSSTATSAAASTVSTQAHSAGAGTGAGPGQSDTHTHTHMRDRSLSDFVSREKMDKVVGDCRRTLDSLAARNLELEALLAEVKAGTEQLKDEERASNLDDLDECEKDAKESHDRLVELLAAGHNQEGTTEDAEEIAGITEDTVDRLGYLVERRVGALEAESIVGCPAC